MDLSRAFQDAVTVQVDTAETSIGLGIDAVSGTDFTPLTGMLVTFDPGETSKMVAVEILDDPIVEPNETFTVSLSDPQVDGMSDSDRLVLGTNSTATGTIVNTDSATLSIDDFTDRRRRCGPEDGGVRRSR